MTTAATAPLAQLTGDDLRAWAVRYYETLDARDLDALLAFYSPQATAALGNADPVPVGQYFGNYASRRVLDQKHHVNAVHRDGNTVLVRGQMTFRRTDAVPGSLHFVTCLEASTEGLTSCHVYLDPAPLRHAAFA